MVSGIKTRIELLIWRKATAACCSSDKPGIPNEPMRNVNKNWTGEVTKSSNALDLEEGVFTWDDPRQIALSLKRSAEQSQRRKAPPFQSAMSMLNFYVNRAGKNLKPPRRKILERAKRELRTVFKNP